MTEKICSRCGKTFGCGSPEAGCWCESLTVSPENLALLKKDYDNCLCPECLAVFAEKKNSSAEERSDKG